MVLGIIIPNEGDAFNWLVFLTKRPKCVINSDTESDNNLKILIFVSLEEPSVWHHCFITDFLSNDCSSNNLCPFFCYHKQITASCHNL